PLGLGRLSLDRPQIVEVLPVGAGAEGPRREGHEDLALGAPPQAEPDQLHAGERSHVSVEDELGLAHEALGGVLPLDELHTHEIPRSGLPVIAPGERDRRRFVCRKRRRRAPPIAAVCAAARASVRATPARTGPEPDEYSRRGPRLLPA